MAPFKRRTPGLSTPLPALPGSLGLGRRLALCQRLGKGWLPAFLQLPPLSGCRAGPLLGSPIAKRVNSGSSGSIIIEDLLSLLLLLAKRRPQLRRRKNTKRQKPRRIATMAS